MADEPTPPFPPDEGQGPGIARLLAAQEERRQRIGQWIDRAIAHLQEKWADRGVCPYCQHENWDVGKPVTMPSHFDDDMLLLVPVICTNCGHTVLVNVRTAGLPEQAEP